MQDNFAESTRPNSTQRARILGLLIRARGSWVPLSEIITLAIVQYNARLYELRRLGFQIENCTERQGGQRHSWFRLALGESALPSCSTKSDSKQPAFPELGELAPENRYPD